MIGLFAFVSIALAKYPHLVGRLLALVPLESAGLPPLEADTLDDHLRAAARLSLMAEGFGGGTDIAGSLSAFADGYGAKALNGRTVVIILSDGYCTRDPQALSDALARIRRKARRIVWLNPLKGWRDYAPVAAAIRAAEPHLDAHLPANTLAALAALEPEFSRL